MGLVVAIALLAIVSGTAAFLAYTAFSSREAALSRLQRVSSGATPQLRSQPVGELSLRERVAQFVELLSGSKVKEDDRDGTYAKLRQQLVEAGFRRPSALRVYMGSRVAATLGIAILIFPLSTVFVDSGLMVLVVLIGAAGLGFIAPGLVVDSRRSVRQRAIIRGLPDALDLMVVCVEAGLSLAATLDRVAKEFFRTNVVLASELKLVVLETQAGKSLSEALRSLSTRNGIQDLSTLASALVQTERLGTRVADTLRVQSDALRTRRMQQAEEVAQRAPVKMLIPAGLFIFPALLVVTAIPAFLGISKALQ